MNKVNKHLIKLISSNLYARYSGILSLSDISLFVIDTNSHILLEFIPSPDFCTHICQERPNQVCEDYRNRCRSGREGMFVCRYGLENILLPIKVKDEIVGYIGGMQVYSQGTEYKKHMIDINALKNGKESDLESIAKAISSLKTAELNKIKIHEQLCEHIARNISLDLSESQEHPVLTRLSIEKEMLEKKIIELEAKNMALVINPHFLFNTLNSIARIAYFEQSHTTEELIYCLSDLLRYNLKQNDQLHTVASEIDNIEKYLYIQKVRFRDRLDYEINVPEKIRPYRMPNMIIQPLVENALIHGLAPKRDGGKISIFGEKINNLIVITIADNGVGFPKSVLEKIQNSQEIPGLGFQSTDKRIKRYYGEQYGLKIVKSDYSGSTVTVTFPIQPLGGAQVERRLNC